MTESLGEQSTQRLLDAVAARTTAPGGGVVTGVVAALAGALVEMCARFSGSDLTLGIDSTESARRAARLQARAVSLAQSDGAVYAEYRQARRAGGAGDLAAALDEAIRIPLEMAEVAAELAEIALGLARSGNPNLRGDATTAVLMGVAAAKAGAVLVAENLSGTGAAPTHADHGLADPTQADHGLADHGLADPTQADPTLADPTQADHGLADPRLARAAAIVASATAAERAVLSLYPVLRAT